PRGYWLVCPYIHFFNLRPSQTSTLFPYTTLFRSLTDWWVRMSNETPIPRDTNPAIMAPIEYGQAVEHAVPTTARPLVRGTRYLRSEEHTSELQSRENLVCRLLLEKKKQPM